MRALLVLGLLAAACSGPETPEPPPPSPPVAPAPLDARTLAGEWRFTVTGENGDTIPGFSLNAADTAWTMQFDGRDPMPVSVSMDGDSVVQQFGPYESVMRPGVTVHTTIVSRLRNGEMDGELVARYTNAGADSIMRARAIGRRSQQP